MFILACGYEGIEDSIKKQVIEIYVQLYSIYVTSF